MTDPTSSLGGFRPDAGLNHHEAGAPQRIPVPSLLRSLLTDHLDPGYAAAAAKRTDPRAESLPARLRAGGWALLGGLTIAAVFAAAASQAQSVAPVNRHTQQVLADSVRAGETRTDAVEAHRDALATEVEAERRSRLAGDEQGRALLAALEDAEFAAAATPAIGPGVTVTVTDPGMSPDLSDVSKQRVAGSQQVILDRDLQLVVNSLWVGGAEAVSVGGCADRAQCHDPAGRRRHPGRQPADHQSVRDRRAGPAACHAGCVQPQPRYAAADAAAAVLRCRGYGQYRRGAQCAWRLGARDPLCQRDWTLKAWDMTDRATSVATT